MFCDSPTSLCDFIHWFLVYYLCCVRWIISVLSWNRWFSLLSLAVELIYTFFIFVILLLSSNVHFSFPSLYFFLRLFYHYFQACSLLLMAEYFCLLLYNSSHLILTSLSSQCWHLFYCLWDLSGSLKYQWFFIEFCTLCYGTLNLI